ELCKQVKPAVFHFSDVDIIKIWYWAVIHDRPVSWACQRTSWSPHLRRQRLPSNTTMSRRLRSRSVLALQKQLEERVIAPRESNYYWMIDGKSMMIGGGSGDRQAGYGRAANCKAKGYKLHVIRGIDDSIVDWRIAPLNKDE